MKKLQDKKNFISIDSRDITLDADREYTLDEIYQEIMKQHLDKIYQEIMKQHLDGLSVNDSLRILSDLIFNVIVQASKSKEDFKNKVKIYHRKVSNIYNIYLEMVKENSRWK